MAGCMFYSLYDFCLRMFLWCSTSSADMGDWVLSVSSVVGQEEARGATAQGEGLFFLGSFVQKPGTIR